MSAEPVKAKPSDTDSSLKEPNNPESLLSQGLPIRPWTVAVALVFAFFLLSMFFSYRSIGVMQANNIAVTNSMQVVALLNELRLNIARAESGQRGYLLTTDNIYLEPYHQTLSTIDELLHSLANAPTSAQAQEVKLDQLFEEVESVVSEMEQVIRLVNSSDYLGALTRMHAGTGAGLVSEVNRLINRLEVTELLQLQEKRSQAEETRTLILAGLIATNLIGLLLACGIFIAAYYNARRLATLYGQIESANAKLESKVQARTQALQLYSEELQRSNRELEEFAFVASHDLQEPLRKIRAFGDRLLQKYSGPLGERGADYVARMHSASERMSLLINDLLSFSRVTTKRSPFAQVNLNTILGKALEDLEFSLEESGGKVEYSSLPTIDADATQIGQVFMNLISNSLKFRRSDVAPLISIRYELGDQCKVDPADEREWCCLYITDNGIGFEQEYADRVFNLFQRLHGRDEYAGTGIGLALCRKIVERHGGTIRVASEPNKGTEFSIRLPTSQPTNDDMNDLHSESGSE